MTARRNTDKPHLEPDAVWALDSDHPAMTGDRTIFPSTVVEVTTRNPDRLLVSGQNSRKLGSRVSKGSLAGHALYGLTLEERATCPSACTVRDVCYGNGMHLARRHRIGDPAVFEARLKAEIGTLLIQHPTGLLVRLHVLGDFPSADYVAMWGRLLDRNPRLACYGYTHRLPTRMGGCPIGDAVAAVKARHPARFRIRWSVDAPVPDGAVVIGDIPGKARVEQGLVCPAQTEATACCASCGLCWEPAAAGQTIVFIRHGRTSGVRAAHAAMAAIEDARQDTAEPGTRRITALRMPANMRPAKVVEEAPRFESVDPRTLLIEERYQRDLTPNSVRLIRKIVTGWDWSKFKPPVCARTPAGLFVIDGQHTSIGAATHPDIVEIPVMVVPAGTVEARALSFVAHNRERVVMSEFAMLAAEVAAGIPRAVAVTEAIAAGGGRVPRVMPLKGRARHGDVVSVGAARRLYASQGADHLARCVRIAVDAGCRPIDSTVLVGIHHFLSDHAGAGDDDARTVRSLRRLVDAGDIARAGLHQATVESLPSRYRGVASLLSRDVVRAAAVDGVGDTRPAKTHRPEPAKVERVTRSRTRPSAVRGVSRRRMPGKRFDWTEERIALLRRMGSQGASVEDIAAALGPGVTWNAVHGKLFRIRRKSAKA